MQPVLDDLRGLQNRWNQKMPRFWASRENIKEEVCQNQRPAYLRVLDVALLAFLTFTASASVCLLVSGTLTVLKGGYSIVAFSKLFVGSSLGIISYDLFRLRDIVDQCRVLFREAIRALDKNCVDDAKRLKWNETVKKLETNYEQLYVIDSVLDMLYPTITNH